jgi:hypothetical protein
VISSSTRFLDAKASTVRRFVNFTPCGNGAR